MTWSLSSDLPNPVDESTIRIHVWETALLHMSEHLSSAVEPWGELFDFGTDFRNAKSPEESGVMMTAVATVLEQNLRESLAFGRICAYTQLDQRRYELHQIWEVPTSAGFLIVIRHKKDWTYLVTAYFPTEASKEKPSRRWIGVLKHLLMRIARRIPAAGFYPVGTRLQPMKTACLLEIAWTFSSSGRNCGALPRMELALPGSLAGLRRAVPKRALGRLILYVSALVGASCEVRQRSLHHGQLRVRVPSTISHVLAFKR